MPLSASKARALAAAAASACLLALAALPGTASAAEGECPNEALRVGFSAHLPDCRAYELVTPNVGPLPITTLVGTEEHRDNMDTWMTSPDGESVIFDTNGAIQNENANGKADRYESTRSSSGWVTRLQGPSSEEFQGGFVYLGGATPDHRFSFLQIEGESTGPLLEGNYIRERGGRYVPLGVGSLGAYPSAEAYWSSAGGEHIIFGKGPTRTQPPVQLEPDAPPAPIEAIYERSVDGPTSTASLLPGDITPAGNARYLGTTTDGTAVVFEINGTIYVRRNGASTAVVAYATPGTELSCRMNFVGASQTQWLRNGVPILSATAPQYIVQAADEGAVLQCQVGADGAAATSVPPTLVSASPGVPMPPEPEGAIPAPTPAQPVAGTTESCASGQWSGSPSFSYRWYANGKAIAGATQSTYEVQAADLPATLQCAVSATSAGETVVAFSGTTATNPAPAEAARVPFPTVRGKTPTQSGTQRAIASFAGATSGGGRVFFASGSEDGARFGYESFAVTDTASETTTTIADEGPIWPVQVSEDGSHAYFIAKAVLAANANAFGESALAGQPNLYLWDGSGVRYVATVTPRDVNSKYPNAVADQRFYGLGDWTFGLSDGGGFATNPSRTTSDGSVLVFQTSAPLQPGYENQGHWEVYRFEAEGEGLECVSCNPKGTPASAEAELQTISPNVSERIGVNELTHIPSITPDGKTIVFETRERLLPEDEDDFYDIYRWSEGELALVSSGQSSEDEFLFGMSRNASDIFFQSYDPLTPQDQDGGGQSIYDARVDGGFPPPIRGQACEAEGCQGGLTPAPGLPAAATPGFKGTGNVNEAARPHKPHHKKHRKRRHHKRHAKKAGHGSKGGRR